MMEFTNAAWPVLVRTTLAAGLIGTVAFILLRLLRVRSAVLTRWVCCGVLVQGWIAWQVNVPLPESIQRAVPVQLPSASPVPVRTALPEDQSKLPEFAGVVPSDVVAVESMIRHREHSAIMNGNHRLPVTTGTVLAWTGGMACLLLWTLLGYTLLWRRVRMLSEVNTAWATEWRSALDRQGVAAPVRMLASHDSGPLLFRMPHETVLVVPANRWRVLSPYQRGAVLLHEAAHLRRRDLWKSLAVRVLALPQWFNPLVWWSLRRFDDAAEWGCDDLVNNGSTQQTTDYARALVQLSTRTQASHLVLPAARRRSLTVRVHRLLSPPSKEESRMKSFGLCVVIVLLSGLCALRPQAVAEHQNSTAAASTTPDEDSGLTADAYTASASTAHAARVSVDAYRADDTTVQATPALIYRQLANTGTTQATPALIYERIVAPPGEAVVDMRILFENEPLFQSAKEHLKADVEARDLERQELVRQSRAIREQLQALDGDDNQIAREALGSALNRLHVEMEQRHANDHQELLQDEAEMYFAAYQRISAAIAEYARENGIRLVRRKNSVVEHYRTDGTWRLGDPDMDFSNPKAVLELINSDIVYVQSGHLDITEAVLQRLANVPDSTEDQNGY